MGLRVAVQMDPIGGINIAADSTFRIMEEAQARGHELFYYTPDKLSFRMGRILARGWPLTVRRIAGDHFTLGEETERDLSTQDVVWLRQDPPFDMGYITTTHLLEHLMPATLVVNDPFWVRNSPEKLLVLRFPELIPDTLIARDLAALRAFKREHGDVILKPLYGNGGAGVFRLDPNDRNLQACTSSSPGSRASRSSRSSSCRMSRRATSASSWSTGSPWARSTASRPRARHARTCMWVADRSPWASPRATGRSAPGSGRS
jgi:glutathione synthase